MNEVIEVRTPEASFDVVIPENVVSLYSDGVSNAALGYPISKLLFHKIEPPGFGKQQVDVPPIEQRKVVLEMSIPTAALVELCMNITLSVLQSREVLKAGGVTASDMFSKVLDKLDELRSPS
jgi:hypothetical protein